MLTSITRGQSCRSRHQLQGLVLNGMGLTRSEEHKDLLNVTFDVLNLLTDHVEADSLGDGSALSNSHDITDTETEGGGAVSGNGLVALLESVVLLDEVEVITTDDDSTVHLGGNDHTPKSLS